MTIIPIVTRRCRGGERHDRRRPDGAAAPGRPSRLSADAARAPCAAREARGHGVFGSLYPVFTVLLAAVVLREQPTVIQRLGTGVALAGAVLIAAA
jgi:EamA-like transporter family